MRVVLTQVYDSSSQQQGEYPPLGLGYLAAYARPHLEDAEFIYAQGLEQIISMEPDMVGITTVSENYHLARDLARELRKRFDGPVVLGGIHVSMMPETMTPDFDVGVMGEGEKAFVELLGHIKESGPRWKEGLRDMRGICYHGDDGLVINPPSEPILPLDSIPNPDRDMLSSCLTTDYMDSFTFSMFSSRGCPYNCNFCSSSRFWGRPRFFSAQYVLDEIVTLKEKYGARTIFFWDDLFALNRNRLLAIARMIKARGLADELSFSCNLRSDIVDSELCEILASMNVTAVNIGLESGSDDVLALMNKRVTARQQSEALELLSQHGLLVNGSFVVGYPGETAADMEKTVAFVEKYLGSGLHNLDVFPLVLYPGTEVWERALEDGLLESASSEPYRYKCSPFTLDPGAYLYVNPSADWEEFLSTYLYLKGLAYSGIMDIYRQIATERVDDINALRGALSALQGSFEEARRLIDSLRDHKERIEEELRAARERAPRREGASGNE